MNSTEQPIQHSAPIFFRLTALWILSEGLIGGIIHGLKLPVSGLIAGSISVLCICLIGQFSNRQGAIAQATVLVAVFKFLLSPQAPPTAYIALAFQGCCGILCYDWLRFKNWAPLTIAILSLIESGLQRLLVFSILYGQPVWQLFTESIRRLFGLAATTPVSEWLIGGYLMLHLVAGIITGFFCMYLIRQLPALQKRYGNWFQYANIRTSVPATESSEGRSRRKITGYFILAILLVILAEQTGFLGKPWLSINAIMALILRTLLMLLLWWLVLIPLTRQLLFRWLQRKQQQQQSTIQILEALLPEMRELLKQCRQFAAREKGFRNQLKEFFARLLTGLIPVSHE